MCNKISFTVTNLQPGDMVLATPTSGGKLATNMVMLAPKRSHRMLVDIGPDVPEKGTIRIVDPHADADIYTFFKKETIGDACGFHIAEPLKNNYTGFQCIIPYIDTMVLSNQTQANIRYVTDRKVLVRVRQVGMKPFETTTSIKSSPVSTIRVEDTIFTTKEKPLFSGVYFVERIGDRWITCTQDDICNPSCKPCILIYLRKEYAIFDTDLIECSPKFGDYLKFISSDQLCDFDLSFATTTEEPIILHA